MKRKAFFQSLPAISSNASTSCWTSSLFWQDWSLAQNDVQQECAASWMKTQEHLPALWNVYSSGHFFLATCHHGRVFLLWFAYYAVQGCWKKEMMKHVSVSHWDCQIKILKAVTYFRHLQAEPGGLVLFEDSVSFRLFLLVVLEIGTDWIKFCLIAKFSEMNTKTFEAAESFISFLNISNIPFLATRSIEKCCWQIFYFADAGRWPVSARRRATRLQEMYIQVHPASTHVLWYGHRQSYFCYLLLFFLSIYNIKHVEVTTKPIENMLQSLAPVWPWSSVVSVLIIRCQAKVDNMLQSVAPFWPWSNVVYICSYQGLWKINQIRDKAILVLFSGVFFVLSDGGHCCSTGGYHNIYFWNVSALW